MPATRRRRSRDPFFVWRMRRLRRQLARARLLVFVGLLCMSVPAVALPLMRLADLESQPQPITRVPEDQPALGLVYGGLVPAARGTPCVGAYQVGAATICSHGPDAPPPGLDVRIPAAAAAPPGLVTPVPAQDAQPAPTEAEVARDAGAVEFTGTPAGTPADATAAVIPDASPDPTAFRLAASGVACDGDGRAGQRVQVIYAFEKGTPSRYDAYLPSFRTWAAGVDAIYDASARETGGSRHVRFVTTPACEVDVAEVELPVGGLSTFDKTVTALRVLGFVRTDRKYMIFSEATVYCGIATFAADERPDPGNRSNRGPAYGRIDAGCWSAAVAAHELAHNLGAVNNGAPHSSRAGHCTDEYDLMCYRDASAHATRVLCPDRTNDQRLDCNHDDYYSTAVSPGSYLASHWNVAQSQFLLDPAAPGVGVAATPSASSPAAPASSTPLAPVTTPSDTAAVLRSSAIGATSARLDWDAAAAGSRYVVLLGERRLGVVTVTAVRLVGLRPDRDYPLRIARSGPDGALVPHTGVVTVHTLAASRPPTQTWFTLGNALTGEAAGVVGGRSAEGSPVVLGPRQDGVAQHWLLEPAGAETFLVKTESSGKCLAAGGQVRAGTALVQQACQATGTTRWRIVSTTYGFALAPAGSDLLLGVGGIRYRDARMLVLQPANQCRYQSWTMS